uniref:Beta-hydroxyacyl-ACP dehydratase n=1 Tax=Schlesneria paludicola TaxID=360056 RepID=A0A7C4LJW6_9PLAN
MRYLLVDRILELTPRQSLTAVKNLSLAEEYLADHFPGFPVMPGVLMLESLVQAAGWLIRHSEQFQPSTILLKEARALKFNSFVAPGKTLTVHVTVKKQDGRYWDFQGTGTIEGESAVSARLTLEAFNLAERHPELASSDEVRRQAARELWGQIWMPPQA